MSSDVTKKLMQKSAFLISLIGKKLSGMNSIPTWVNFLNFVLILLSYLRVGAKTGKIGGLNGGRTAYKIQVMQNLFRLLVLLVTGSHINLLVGKPAVYAKFPIVYKHYLKSTCGVPSLQNGWLSWRCFSYVCQHRFKVNEIMNQHRRMVLELGLSVRQSNDT